LTGQDRTARAVTTGILTVSSIKLQNVACLTGYSGGLFCAGLGA